MTKSATGHASGVTQSPANARAAIESAAREVWEELGIRVQLVRLVGLYAETFRRTGGYMLSFVYLGKRAAGKLRPHPEEIDAYDWIPIRKALRMTTNPFARAGLSDYLKGSASV